VFANGLDDKCGQFVYKSAPVVNAEQYICHKQYGIAYSYQHKNPAYTVEYLTADHTGKVARTNDFRVDPQIPPKFQTTPKDYAHTTTECGGGRCDRGHMTPDQDFSADATATSESFFMSNMVPQNFKNNEVIWKNMEMHIRAYVAKGHPVYVITGPAYNSLHPKFIGNHVDIPDKLWKVVVDEASGAVMAFMMDNVALDTHSLMMHQVAVKDIETATGIKFGAVDTQTVKTFKDW